MPINSLFTTSQNVHTKILRALIQSDFEQLQRTVCPTNRVYIYGYILVCSLQSHWNFGAVDFPTTTKPSGPSSWTAFNAFCFPFS